MAIQFCFLNLQLLFTVQLQLLFLQPFLAMRTCQPASCHLAFLVDMVDLAALEDLAALADLVCKFSFTLFYTKRLCQVVLAVMAALAHTHHLVSQEDLEVLAVPAVLVDLAALVDLVDHVSDEKYHTS
jgi:hypothetical protein